VENAVGNEPVQLLLGDCLERLKELADESVDSIVTDPPYGLEFMGKQWDSFTTRDGFRRSRNQNDVGRNNVFARTSAKAPEYYTGADFSKPGIGERETGWPSLTGRNTKRCGDCGLLIGHGDSPCKCETPRVVSLLPERMHAFQAYMTPIFKECLRVLKPGGHLLAFGGSRTYHRLASAIEDAGFEIRDQIMWLYGQGFPKSKNLDGEWEGWGTALKPAHEPIAMARKPLVGTVAANVAQHRTGAINIAESRVPSEGGKEREGEESQDKRYTESGSTNFAALPGPRGGDPAGRWPANVIHDGSDEVVSLFPDSKGQQGDVRGTESSHTGDENTVCYGEYGRVPFAKRSDSGSAARFFYCAKANKKDRGEGNNHPTVKPTELMRYLIKLVTPPAGTVLDPFMGSGSTGKEMDGFRFIGIEKEQPYLEIAQQRVFNQYATAETSYATSA
jgi:site-specific DNA-methyltransferase (adenine-specific)